MFDWKRTGVGEEHITLQRTWGGWGVSERYHSLFPTGGDHKTKLLANSFKSIFFSSYYLMLGQYLNTQQQKEATFP